MVGSRVRAVVVSAPGEAAVEDVPPPVAGPGEAVVDILRAGVCGTDNELFTGEMAYVADGITRFPLRPGHEWVGRVRAVGPGADPRWLGRRVTGDTMIGCGECARCRSGRHHVCEFRDELGIRGDRPGALAERIAVPVRSLLELPDTVDDAMGALVEPGGNAYRAVRAAALEPGDRLLIAGAGTVGLLSALFARADGADVHLLDPSPRARSLARELGFDDTAEHESLLEGPWDAVIDASNDPRPPARAVELVEPGRRVVFVGLAARPSLVDTRRLALKDVTAVGILGASDGLWGTIASYASGAVDPRPLVAATLPLEELIPVLGGARPPGSGLGPKFHAVPRS